VLRTARAPAENTRKPITAAVEKLTTGIKKVAPRTAAVVPTRPTSTRVDGSLVQVAPATVKVMAARAMTTPIRPAESPLVARTSGASRPDTPATVPSSALTSITPRSARSFLAAEIA